MAEADRSTRRIGLCDASTTFMDDPRITDPELMPVAVITTDCDGRIISVNEAAAELLAVEQSAVIGGSPADFMPAESAATWERILAGGRPSEPLYTRNMRLLRSDGRRVNRRLVIGPTGDGERLRMFALDVDDRTLAETEKLMEANRRLREEVTERRRAEEALASQAQELSRSNRDLEQFAYVASHDLQEPLRNVASCIELLKKRRPDLMEDDAAQLIGHAENAVADMRALIKGLLSYSRITTKPIEFRPTDCNVVMEKVLENLRSSIREQGAKVSYDPLPTIECDASQMVRVFQNLIGNAIKFRSDEAPRVHVSAVGDAGAWTFSVSDNGVGVPPEDLERIFTLFKQARRRKKYPGSGVGLAITRWIVETHGGEVWVESVDGKGAVFFVRLPQSRAASP